MELVLDGMSVRLTCAMCKKPFLIKLKYLEVGDRYPCDHCRSYYQFTFADAREIERQAGPREPWWRRLHL